MTVNELYESLTGLIEQGKGDYSVNITCLDGRIDGYSERADEIGIDDKAREIDIQGV